MRNQTLEKKCLGDLVEYDDANERHAHGDEDLFVLDYTPFAARNDAHARAGGDVVVVCFFSDLGVCGDTEGFPGVDGWELRSSDRFAGFRQRRQASEDAYDEDYFSFG